VILVFFASQTTATGRTFVRLPAGWELVAATEGGVWARRVDDGQPGV